MRFESDFDIPYGHKKRLWTLDIKGMSSLRPNINKETCNECGTCYLYCPTGAIVFDDSGIQVVSEFCKGCGICAKECPFTAILMMEIREE
jgi:pyruvate ferredoxin oxidoreductase delta subunit